MYLCVLNKIASTSVPPKRTRNIRVPHKPETKKHPTISGRAFPIGLYGTLSTLLNQQPQ